MKDKLIRFTDGDAFLASKVLSVHTHSEGGEWRVNVQFPSGPDWEAGCEDENHANNERDRMIAEVNEILTAN